VRKKEESKIKRDVRKAIVTGEHGLARAPWFARMEGDSTHVVPDYYEVAIMS
jgi:hypothetical protein